MIDNTISQNLMQSPIAPMTASRYFGIVGTNGVCVTGQEYTLIEATRKLFNVQIAEFPDAEMARSFVYKTYCGNFFARNYHLGVSMSIPLNLPTEFLWIDPDYEKREKMFKTNA